MGVRERDRQTDEKEMVVIYLKGPIEIPMLGCLQKFQLDVCSEYQMSSVFNYDVLPKKVVWDGVMAYL